MIEHGDRVNEGTLVETDSDCIFFALGVEFWRLMDF